MIRNSDELYDIGKNENGEEFIIHHNEGCERKSYHPEDIKQKYCAVCHTFLVDNLLSTKYE